MSERFETLIYTDCRPGQGLLHVAGLQFQARSADAAAAAEPHMQRHLLYEPPARWMAEQRAVEQYPPSFGHVSAGGFYVTASGVYLGKEASGGRQGNQLTHGIVTRDPADYGALRPAQLFGAPFWSTAPAPTVTSEPVTRPAPGPELTPARARDMVLERAAGPEMLVALVSALERAGPAGQARVLLVGPDVTAIMQWLVAGTLLVPRGRAAELGFKVFSNDPARSGLPIVAVHPDFAGPAAALDNRLGYVVFDLTRDRHSEIEVSARAERWAGLFLSEDPLDVVDAVDVAAACGLDDDEPTAAALGLAAILHREPGRQHAETIIRWLRTGPEELRAPYASDIAAIFARTPSAWTHRELLLLDEAGVDGLIPGKAGSVRLALLDRETDDAAARAHVIAERLRPLPAGEWNGAETAAAERAVAAALDTDLPAPHVDALLRVATRFGIGLGISALKRCAQPFVTYWADHYEARFEPRAWPCGAELEDLLIDELTARSADGDASRRRVGEVWWRRLLPRLRHLPQPLAMATIGAAVRFLPEPERATFAGQHLSAAAATDAEGFAWTVTALWSVSPPTIAELRQVVALAPGGFVLPGPVCRDLVERVTGGRELDLEELRLCRELVDARRMRGYSGLVGLLAADRRLDDAIERLGAGPENETEARRWLQRLADGPERLVAARADTVAKAMLGAVAFREVAGVLRRHPALEEQYCGRLARALSTGATPGQMAVAFYLSHSEAVLPDGSALRRELNAAEQRWAVQAPAKRLDAAGELVAGNGKAWAEAWETFAAKMSKSRQVHRIMHPFGRGR
jgi:hypothetical protein